AVHRGIDAARERIDARVTQVAVVLDLDVVRCVERLVLEAGDGRGELFLALGRRVVELALPLRRPAGAGARVLRGGHLKPILRWPSRLLPSAVGADSGGVRNFVAVVICAVLAMPAWATASSAPRALVRAASRLSGLPARGPVRTSTVSAARYGALLARARNRDYPASLQRVDAGLDAVLGLTARTST